MNLHLPLKRQCKHIEGYEGVYEISNYGEVFRLIKYGVEKRTKLKPYFSEKGYLKVGLSINGVRKMFKVHRLVAMTFIENPHNLNEVNHINGDKTDNMALNLEWCTRKYNMVHASRNNLITKRIGKDNPISRKVNQLSVDGLFIKSWDSISDASKEIGVSPSHICSVCSGKRNKAYGFKWEYAN